MCVCVCVNSDVKQSSENELFAVCLPKTCSENKHYDGHCQRKHWKQTLGGLIMWQNHSSSAVTAKHFEGYMPEISPYISAKTYPVLLCNPQSFWCFICLGDFFLEGYSPTVHISLRGGVGGGGVAAVIRPYDHPSSDLHLTFSHTTESQLRALVCSGQIKFR